MKLEAFADQEFSVIWSFPNNQRDILEGISIPANVHLEDFLPQVFFCFFFGSAFPNNNRKSARTVVARGDCRFYFARWSIFEQ